MCLIEDQSWIDCIDITSRWDTFVSFHLYGNKGVSLPLWPIRPRWFNTYSPCAEPLGDGHEGMWARFGSQGSIALNWHSRYSGTRYSGTWVNCQALFQENISFSRQNEKSSTFQDSCQIQTFFKVCGSYGDTTLVSNSFQGLALIIHVWNHLYSYSLCKKCLLNSLWPSDTISVDRDLGQHWLR